MNRILKELQYITEEPFDEGVDILSKEWMTNPNWNFDSSSWEDLPVAKKIEHAKNYVQNTAQKMTPTVKLELVIALY